jgi:hypothetical protein
MSPYPYKRKRGQKKDKTNQKQYDSVRNKRFVVEREQTLDGI